MADLYIDGVFVGNTVGRIEVNSQHADDIPDLPEETPAKLIGFQPCPATDATITLHGLTPSKSCPPIVTKRSELCPCGTVHPNGLRKPWKTCCGKGKT